MTTKIKVRNPTFDFTDTAATGGVARRSAGSRRTRCLG
jgi:hypothetical protein